MRSTKNKIVMARKKYYQILGLVLILFIGLGVLTCKRTGSNEDNIIKELSRLGLATELISAETFYKGISPRNFDAIAGASYKPSYNEEPNIPPHCWVETSYGTQNACKYCHTDYLASIKHGNAFPIAEDQILYSFPSPNLNRILWQNIIYPQNIEKRLLNEGISLPDVNDVDYVRFDNWSPVFQYARKGKDSGWLNKNCEKEDFILFPALDPNHLFPFNDENPTGYGSHGYIDEQGFVRNENHEYTGWRAVNFFPYSIFTPLTGSVSGIYIRLPKMFMSSKGKFCVETYMQNFDLLEKNIKNHLLERNNYVGDAEKVPVLRGFYPIGTEFAHPLHYVDLNADGEVGIGIDGVVENTEKSYEFPGTRSKRVKEIRYMYKWKDVTLDDIALEEEEESGDYQKIVGFDGHGWIDNGAGWILAGYIENRQGNLRPQTTEELMQCLGCHSNVGNTIDAVWSFQRKFPFEEGWADMNYGKYQSQRPNETKLHDYINETSGMGEFGYFLFTVVGADLFGVMPSEVRDELKSYAKSIDLKKELSISFSIDEILNDEILKSMERSQRMPRLLARQRLMRHYSKNLAYLYVDEKSDNHFIKGNIFYPTHETMKLNIQGYRKIVLDQSFNLGKDAFGSESDNIPFTFRSDGSVLDEHRNLIPAGEVISSRPFNEEGVGITPTGIVLVDSEQNVVDRHGNPIDPLVEPEKAVGHISTGGTFDTRYNPILSGKVVKRNTSLFVK